MPQDSAQPELAGLYRRVAGALASAAPASDEQWRARATRLDAGQRRPRRRACVEEHEVESQLVLYSPEADAYLTLSDQEAFVWRQLDGSHSVRDVEVAYLAEFKTIGANTIAALLGRLKAGAFLDEPRRALAERVAAAVAERTAEGRIQQVRRRLAKRRLWEGEDVAGMAAAARLAAPLLRSPFATAALGLLAAAGLVGFGLLFTLGRGQAAGAEAVAFVKVFGSYVLGVLALVAGHVALGWLHEVACAAALKGRGGRVPQYEFTLRYGLPVWAADLRQICLLPVRGRAAVLLAGVLVELAVGGLLALVALAAPNNLCFNLAALAYVRVFCSLGPWFDTRGYLAASALLGLPHWRGQAMALVRDRWWRDTAGLVWPLALLWIAFRPLTPPDAGVHWRGWVFAGLLAVLIGHTVVASRRRAAETPPAPWTPHEKAGAAFLAAGLAWWLVAAWLCLGALGSQVFAQGFMRDLAGDTWLVTKILMLVLLAAPLAVLLAFLAASAVLLLLYGWRWARSASAWRDSGRLAQVLWIVAGTVAFGHLLFSGAAARVWLAYATPAGAAACVAASAAAWRRNRASEPGAEALLIGAFALLWLAGGLLVRAPAAAAVCRLAGSAALAACALGLLCGRSHPKRDLWAAAAVGAAVLAGLLPAARAFAVLPFWWPDATPLIVAALAAGLALAAFTPTLLDRSASRNAASAAMWAAGFAALALSQVVALDHQTLIYLPPDALQDLSERIRGDEAFVARFSALGLSLLAAGAALSLHVAATSRLPVPKVAAAGESDLAKVKHAFESFAATLLSDVSALRGAQAALRVASAANAKSAELSWGLSILPGAVDTSRVTEASLSQAASTLHEAAQALAAQAERIAGARAVEAALLRVYDRLPWDTRELATTHLFHAPQWAAALEARPRIKRDELQAALRETVLFRDLGDANMDALCRRFRVCRFKPGQVIVRQGDEGDRFYLIQQGAVEVVAHDAAGRTRVLAHLHAGEYFGEIALIERCPRTATCRAETDVSAYVLDREDFDEFVVDCAEAGELIVDTIANVRRLRQVPIFQDLSEAQRALLLSRLQVERCPAGRVVFNQGDPGQKFYVAREGEVEIVANAEGGEERTVATLGPGEYFGEIALLSDVPRTAAARAKTDVELWSLDGHDFVKLIRSKQVAAGALQQTATRRLRQLRERLL